MSQEPEWMQNARKHGLFTREMGVRVAALTGEPVSVPKPVSDFMRAALDNMSEADFQSAVCDLAHVNGWKVAHFRKVRVQRADGSVFWETPVAEDGKGFPDLMLAKAGFRPLFAELKVKRNVPSPEQWEWIHLLRETGANVHLWYPSDWTQIQAVLGGTPADDPSVAQELLRLADDGCPHGSDD